MREKEKIFWCEQGTRVDLVSFELVHSFDIEAQRGIGPGGRIYKNELHAWVMSLFLISIFCDGSIPVMESILLVTFMPTSDLRMPSSTLSAFLVEHAPYPKMNSLPSTIEQSKERSTLPPVSIPLLSSMQNPVTRVRSFFLPKGTSINIPRRGDRKSFSLGIHSPFQPYLKNTGEVLYHHLGSPYKSEW